MKCLASYHVGELRLVNLRKDLEGLPEDDSGLIRRAVDRAIALMEPAT